MAKYGEGYSTEPHGEVHFEAWYECAVCHYQWSVDQPEDACDCEDRMADEECCDAYD